MNSPRLQERLGDRTTLKIAALVSLITLSPALTRAVEVPLVGDAYTKSTAVSKNFGAKTTLFVQGPPISTTIEASYLQFDLSALPSGTTGADVTKATLTLGVHKVGAAGSFDVFRVTGAWTEAAITASNPPTLAGSPEVSAVTLAPTDKNTFKTIEVTNLVKDWLNNVLANNGMALVPNGAGVSAILDSKESTSTSHFAQLDIELGGIASVAKGGTGATTAAGARSNLGAAASGANTDIFSLKRASDSSRNTAVGYEALEQNIGGTNTAVGDRALFHNTSGNDNTAHGVDALNNNTGGGENTAMGSGSLESNTVGNQNTALGAYALVYDNTGSANTAVGDSALDFLSNGSMNTAVGELALNRLTTGSNNTAIGWAAGGGITTGSDNIYIGNGGANESQTIRIGYAQSATYIQGIYGQLSSGGGTVLVNGSGKLGTILSSRRYKDDIRDMGDASNALLKLRPVSFRYKRDLDPSGLKQYGLVAEEVAKLYPDLVIFDDTGRPETVRYQFLAPMLLNELQKQARQNTAQQQEIKAQRQEIEALTAQVRRVSTQAQQIETLTARLIDLEAAVKAQSRGPAVEARLNRGW